MAKDLKAVMPTDLPQGWSAMSWWDLYWYRSPRGEARARVYLNGFGKDDELRFIVWHPTKQYVPCRTCKGVGRIERPERPKMNSIFTALISSDAPHDPVDENGLRRCMACRDGEVNAVYGASNSFIYAPGLESAIPQAHLRLGARGLANPTLEDVTTVMKWVEWVWPKILSGEVT